MNPAARPAPSALRRRRRSGCSGSPRTRPATARSGSRSRGDPGGHGQHDRIGRVPSGSSSSPGRAMRATRPSCDRQTGDTAVEAHGCAALSCSSATAGSISASDNPSLGTGRNAGFAAAHQGLAHHRAQQPGQSGLRAGVERGDRERFDQAPVQAGHAAWRRRPMVSSLIRAIAAQAEVVGQARVAARGAREQHPPGKTAAVRPDRPAPPASSGRGTGKPAGRGSSNASRAPISSI